MDNEKFQELVLEQLKILAEGQQVLETRIGGIETHMDAIDTRMDGIITRMDAIIPYGYQ